MRPEGVAVVAIGAVLVVAAFWVLFATTELAEIVSPVVVLAVALLVLGVVVMAASGRVGATAVRHEHVHER